MAYNLQNVSPITKVVNDTNGVAERRVVVSSGSANPQRQVSNAAGPNVGSIQGVTMPGQNRQNNQSVGILTFGEVPIIAAGPIAKDAPVNVADTTGRVKQVNETTGTLIYQVGAAVTPASALGDEVIVRLTPGRTYTA